MLLHACEIVTGVSAHNRAFLHTCDAKSLGTSGFTDQHNQAFLHTRETESLGKSTFPRALQWAKFLKVKPLTEGSVFEVVAGTGRGIQCVHGWGMVVKTSAFPRSKIKISCLEEIRGSAFIPTNQRVSFPGGVAEEMPTTF